MCGGVRIGVIDLQTGERRPDTLGILRMFEGVTAWCLG